MPNPTRSVRIFFDSLDVAVEALIVVLTDAREGDSTYRFGGLSAKQILDSGLLLQGDINKILGKLDKLPGTVVHDE